MSVVPLLASPLPPSAAMFRWDMIPCRDGHQDPGASLDQIIFPAETWELKGSCEQRRSCFWLLIRSLLPRRRDDAVTRFVSSQNTRFPELCCVWIVIRTDLCAAVVFDQILSSQGE